jgi:hypothetical protein
VPTRVDPQHFAHAPISAVAAGEHHSATVTAGGALYTWGRGEQGALGLRCPAAWPRRPCKQARADAGASAAAGRGARGTCHGLLEELALAFAMGTHGRHGRLGAGAGAGGGDEGQGVH